MAEFNLGYEVECIGPLGRQQLAEKLTADLNLPVVANPIKPLKYDVWNLVNDSSIKTRSRKIVSLPIEIISPVKPLNEALNSLQTLFNWMTKNQYKTNNSTGFHVGLSFVDKAKQEKIDNLKLLFHFDETNFVDLWKRTGNRYCYEIKNNLEYSIQSNMPYFDFYGDWAKTKFTFLNSPEKINKSLPKMLGKYKTINFTKLPNYLEFRLMGGMNYHKKMSLIRQTIAHLTQCLEKSIDPEIDKDKFAEYTKGLIGSTIKKQMATFEHRKKQVQQALLSAQQQSLRIQEIEQEFQAQIEEFGVNG